MRVARSAHTTADPAKRVTRDLRKGLTGKASRGPPRQGHLEDVRRTWARQQPLAPTFDPLSPVASGSFNDDRKKECAAVPRARATLRRTRVSAGVDEGRAEGRLFRGARRGRCGEEHGEREQAEHS